VGFDQPWFDELRMVTRAVLNAVHANGIVGYSPDFSELLRDGRISQRCYDESECLINLLAHTPFNLSPVFKTSTQSEQHIFNFPYGRAWRTQWNLGFSAEPNPADDHVRIGIGVDLSGWDQQGIQGQQDYTDWVLLRVAANRPAFDATFSQLGPYSEPATLFANAVAGQISLAQAVVADLGLAVNKKDWRFFGRVLRYSVPQDRGILHSVPALAQEALRVFQVIQGAGFHP